MICRICGQAGQGESFEKWVKSTFTDHDKLVTGEIICNDCLFWFDERSEELAHLVGKNKPQRVRNYSHFIVDNEWIPLSKGDKKRMQELLFNNPFPELAAIAESGQKHIVFRATRNPPDVKAGWIQFEEQSLFVQPEELKALLSVIESLYTVFSKTEIEMGNYSQHRVRQFGLDRWYSLEAAIRHRRGSLLFLLALFLAQKGGSIDTGSRDGSGFIGSDMARRAGGLQKPLSDEHLATVRGSGEECSLYEQSIEVRQLGLPEVGSESGKE